MKKRKKIMGIVTFVIVLSLLILSGCGKKNNGKSESEILSDIQTQDYMISDYNLNVDSSSITKRQTNPEQKTDYVWVSLTASNEEFSYSAEYYLEYILYNDGWHLENIEETNISYLAKNPESVTNQQAEAFISDLGYDNWSFVSREEDTNQVTLTYSTSVSEYYRTNEYLIAIQYTFTPWNSWDNVSYDTTQTNVTWDIIGEWRYRDDTRDFYIRITDYDLENNSIKLEYTLINVDTRSALHGIQNLSTNGIVERYFGQYDWNQRYVDDPDYFSFIWIYTEEASLDPGGIGYGVSVNGYWLTKQ